MHLLAFRFGNPTAGVLRDLDFAFALAVAFALPVCLAFPFAFALRFCLGLWCRVLVLPGRLHAAFALTCWSRRTVSCRED